MKSRLSLIRTMLVSLLVVVAVTAVLSLYLACFNSDPATAHLVAKDPAHPA